MAQGARRGAGAVKASKVLRLLREMRALAAHFKHKDKLDRRRYLGWHNRWWYEATGRFGL